MGLTYAALALALAGLWLAWRANKQNRDLRERIAGVNSRVYHLRREMEEARQQADQTLLSLKYELLKLQGNLSVTGQMAIGDIQALHPQASQVLAGFHIGGCAGCAVDPRQTLAEAAALNGRPLEPILAALNMLVTGSSNGPALPEQFKTPNVQLQL